MARWVSNERRAPRSCASGLAERDQARRARLQARWLVREGRGGAEAGRLAGVGGQTVERWLGWYRAGRLVEVLRRVSGHGARGAAARLAPEQRPALLARAGRGAFRTYGEARDWVAYTYQGIYAVLARLGGPPQGAAAGGGEGRPGGPGGPGGPGKGGLAAAVGATGRASPWAIWRTRR